MKHARSIGLFVALATAACTTEQVSEKSSIREVSVALSEFAFTSSDSVFEAGVPYRFVFRNDGYEAHEWAVVPQGDPDETNLLFEVEEDELPAGATVVREITFPEPGNFDFACYMPGHYTGGMVLPIRVIAGSEIQRSH